MPDNFATVTDEVQEQDETRELLDCDVYFLSLVDRGANQKNIIYKSEKQKLKPNIEKTINIVKQDGDKRLVYGIVYSPNEVDAHGDYAKADAIERMAHNFMKKARTGNVDRQHNYETGIGFVAESFIVRKGDEMFSDEEGAWAVAIKVEDEMIWAAVKDGRIGGISMAGFAETNVATNVATDKSKKSLREKINQFLETEFSKVFKNDIINLIEGDIEMEKADEKLQDEVVEQEVTDEAEVVEKTDEVKVEDDIENLDLPEMVEKDEEAEKEMEAKSLLEKQLIDQQGITTDLKEEVKTLTEKVEELEKTVSLYEELEKRLAVVEKSSNGLSDVQIDEPIEKRIKPTWSQKIAAQVNK